MADNEGSEKKSGKLAWKTACAEGKPKRAAAQGPAMPQRKPASGVKPLAEGPASSVTYKKNPVPVESSDARGGLIPESQVKTQTPVSPSGKWERFKRKAIRIGVLAVSLVALVFGTNFGFGLYKDMKAKEEKVRVDAEDKKDREEKVGMIVERMKACPDDSLIPNICLDDQTVQVREKAAKMLAQGKYFDRAGVIYAQIGKAEEAGKMIGECETKNDKKCSGAVKRELDIMNEALQKADGEMKKKREMDAVESKTKVQKRVKEVAARIRSCKDVKLLQHMCLDDESFKLLENTAKAAESVKDLENAGTIFASIGNGTDASRLAKTCEEGKNRKCADRIREELKISADALEKALTGKEQ